MPSARIERATSTIAEWRSNSAELRGPKNFICSRRRIRTSDTRAKTSRVAATPSGIIAYQSARRDSNPHLPITAYRVEAGTDTSAYLSPIITGRPYGHPKFAYYAKNMSRFAHPKFAYYANFSEAERGFRPHGRLSPFIQGNYCHTYGFATPPRGLEPLCVHLPFRLGRSQRGYDGTKTSSVMRVRGLEPRFTG